MSGLAPNELTVSCQQYRTLWAVAEAIISHRDLHVLFHDLVDRLRRVVRFDYLILVLHDRASNTMRRHILEPSAPIDAPVIIAVEEGPSGWVWQTQQPLIIPNLAEETRWPRLLEPLKQTISSLCYVALTTARHAAHLLFLNEQEEVDMWDGTETVSFGGGQMSPGSGDVALSADGTWLAVGGSTPLTVWDVPTKRLLLKLPGKRAYSLAPSAWSPNRALLAAGSSDGSIAIWNIPQIRAQLGGIGLDWE